MNGRVYDPILARFTSADPWDPYFPGVGTNRYSYALDAPLNYLDPNGYSAIDPASE